MYPVLFKIGGLTITSFGLMMGLAFLAGGWVFSAELRRLREDPDLAWDLVMYAAVGGILGAKLYYMLLHWDRTAADPAGAILSRGGLVWYGGFITAALLILWAIRRRKLSVPKMADASAPALAIAYAVGRLGCFLVGDDYGRPSDLPWAVAFPQGAPPSTAGNLRDFGVAIPPGIADHVVLAVHPTQLYEVTMSLVIFAILWRLRKRLATPGSLFAIWLALAGVERLVVEIFRAKDDRFVGGLTLAQLISIALIVFGILAFQHARRATPGTQVAGVGRG